MEQPSLAALGQSRLRRSRAFYPRRVFLYLFLLFSLSLFLCLRLSLSQSLSRSLSLSSFYIPLAGTERSRQPLSAILHVRPGLCFLLSWAAACLSCLSQPDTTRTCLHRFHVGPPSPPHRDRGSTGRSGPGLVDKAHCFLEPSVQHIVVHPILHPISIRFSYSAVSLSGMAAKPPWLLALQREKRQVLPIPEEILRVIAQKVGSYPMSNM